MIWPRHCAVATCLKPLGADEPNFICEDCYARLPVDHDMSDPEIHAVFTYTGAIPQLIQDFKFRRHRYVAVAFAAWMAGMFDIYYGSLANPVVVPVPLHPMREKERTFNQSEDLAIEMAKAAKTNIPVNTTAFARVRNTAHQSRSSRNERLKNLESAFAVVDANAIYGKDVIVVDDVTTTGTTFRTCKKPLVAAGAKSVHMLALARAVDNT